MRAFLATSGCTYRFNINLQANQEIFEESEY